MVHKVALPFYIYRDRFCIQEVGVLGPKENSYITDISICCQNNRMTLHLNLFNSSQFIRLLLLLGLVF